MKDLEDFLADKNILKAVTNKYVIYDREWLANNLDMEIESIKAYKSWKQKQAMRTLDFINSEEGKAALADLRKGKQ